MAANSLGANVHHGGYYYSTYCAIVLMGYYAGHLLFISTCIGGKIKDNGTQAKFKMLMF